MRLICFWCAFLTLANAQEGGFYTPQTYTQNADRLTFDQRQRFINGFDRQRLFKPLHRTWSSLFRLPNRLRVADAGLFLPMHRPWNTLMRIPNRIDQYHKELFAPAERNDVTPQGSIESWRPVAAPAPAPVREPWREPVSFNQGPALPRPEPWRAPYNQILSKEQQAAIIHHKQSLSREGAFRFEYASDNGLAAGEVIEPDGSRVGAYQYKDPSGQLVKLKYRAGKDGFQILEGSHLPKSPEPVPPPTQDNHYVQAYEDQRRQFELQQQYNQQRNEPQQGGAIGREEGRDGRPSGGQYYAQSWAPGQEDDGQYRENEVESQNRGPHTFGEGYAFSFQG